MQKQYSFKITTYLNAAHAIRWEDKAGQIHPHTWEIITQIKALNQTSFPNYRFTQIEELLTEVLKPFAQSTINHIAPFDELNPTIENFTDHLFDQFNQALTKLDCQLLTLEVAESPTRSCVITITEKGEQ